MAFIGTEYGTGPTSKPLELTIRPEKTFWSEEGPSFGDFLDIINPLHHIPLISDIYESLTGDTQSTGSQLAGGALFGGPIGFIAAIANNIIEGETGKDIGSNMLAMFDDEKEEAQQLASNTSAAPQTASSAYLKTAGLL
jgi:hypothetical protein